MPATRERSFSPGDRPPSRRREAFRPRGRAAPAPTGRMMTNDDNMSAFEMAGHGSVNGLALRRLYWPPATNAGDAND
jgi:hypothetical protein